MCFPMSLRWSSYVAPKPPFGDSKMQNGRFRCKIALCLKKVCYNVFCVKTVSDRVVRHSLAQLSVQKWLVRGDPFIGPTIRAKMIGEGRPLLPEILGQTDRVVAKSPIFTTLHGMQTRLAMRILVVCPSVCPSVRLSHAWIVTKR